MDELPSRGCTRARDGPEQSGPAGVLQAIDVHEGPPHGADMTRVAIIQNHATRTWAVTAAVVHPGVGMMDAQTRHVQGEALSSLLDVAARTEKIDELLIVVRTVPEDGAERDLWVSGHRRPGAPVLAEQDQRRPRSRPVSCVGADRDVRDAGRS